MAFSIREVCKHMGEMVDGMAEGLDAATTSAASGDQSPSSFVELQGVMAAFGMAIQCVASCVKDLNEGTKAPTQMLT
jgi:hypothetical protein